MNRAPAAAVQGILHDKPDIVQSCTCSNVHVCVCLFCMSYLPASPQPIPALTSTSYRHGFSSAVHMHYKSSCADLVFVHV